MPTNLRQFNIDVNGHQTDVDSALTNFHRRLHMEALARIVRRTPVDTGRARGNWQSSIGSPASGQRTFEDPVGTGMAQLGVLPPYSKSFITNNVPYILVLEDGGFTPPEPGPSKDRRKGRLGRVLVRGGYSVQAPQGMAGITVEELRRWVEA